MLLPEITPRSSAGTLDVKRKAPTTLHDFSAAPEKWICDWTPHDVAEWLYSQATKDDYAHTFLVHGIDGPALLTMTKERLVDWKVKQTDCNVLLKAIQELKVTSAAQGARLPSPASPMRETTRTPPMPADATASPTGRVKPRTRVKPPSSPSPAERTRADAAPTTPSKQAPKTAPPSYAQNGGGATTRGATLHSNGGHAGGHGGGHGGGHAGGHGGGHEAHARSMSSRTLTGGTNGSNGTRSSYLHSVMTELHSNERVPLWKEEMVERVKRRSSKGPGGAAFSASMPFSSRTSALNKSNALPRAKSRDNDDVSVAESSPGKKSVRSHEIERRFHFYQDSIHEHELQRQMLEAKIREINEELAELAAARHTPESERVGLAHADKAREKRMAREVSRLSKMSLVSEQRVCDAERANRELMELINKLRHGRSEFLKQLGRLNEREAAMSADMKHFAQAAHASLDEKEKVEVRLKRQQFDYKQEGNHFEQTRAALDEELERIDTGIADANENEEDSIQQERRKDYAALKAKRDVEQQRELRLGYLQNQVRGHEAEFGRLHRLIGVRFTPDKPESVDDVVHAALSNEERNASLLGFVTVQRQQIESMQEEVRALYKEAEALVGARAEEEKKLDASEREAMRDVESYEACKLAVESTESLLGTLCRPTETLFTLLECTPPSDGGLFMLKGCRPDTLVDHLREIGTQLKLLHYKAMELVPNAEGVDEECAESEGEEEGGKRQVSEALRSFVQPAVVPNHKSVLDLRKELEVAAQKQVHKAEGFGDEGSAMPTTPE